jgi:hypothetical protein
LERLGMLFKAIALARVVSRRARTVLIAGLSISLAISTRSSAAAQADAAQTPLKDLVCRYRRAVSAGDQFSLMSLPAPRQVNESGVLLLVNCSTRELVSVRDPSRSPRHVREFVYDLLRRARLPHDPNAYQVLNFNERMHNTPFQHTAFSRQQGWTGPCVFDGLELTTVDPANPQDRRTITFNLDICRNQVLGMLKAPTATGANKPVAGASIARD